MNCTLRQQCLRYPGSRLVAVSPPRPVPGLSGVDLAKQLATAWPDLPIIWMSGYTRDSAFSDGLMRDDQAFLQKPVANDLLARTLAQVLEVRAFK